MLKPKKIIIFSLVAFAFILSTTLPILALDLTGKLGNVGSAAGFTQTNQNRLPQVIGNIIKGFLSLLGIIFLGYTLYAGYLWLMARGNEEQLSKAKAIIRGSIIGLIIVLAAYVITGFVVNRLTSATGYAPPVSQSASP